MGKPLIFCCLIIGTILKCTWNVKKNETLSSPWELHYPIDGTVHCERLHQYEWDNFMRKSFGVSLSNDW